MFVLLLGLLELLLEVAQLRLGVLDLLAKRAHLALERLHPSGVGESESEMFSRVGQNHEVRQTD